MTERTINEKRRLVAEKIMGWLLLGERDLGFGRRPTYVGEDNLVIDAILWQPDQNIAQAMIVAEALRVLGWQVQLTSEPLWRNESAPHEFRAVWFGPTSLERGKVFLFGDRYKHQQDNPEQAIFAVAVQIAERMEKDA